MAYNVEVFDRLALKYDAWFERRRTLYQAELRALKAIVLKGKGLEVGVGTGRFAIPLGVPFGVEPARGMATLAKRRGVKVCLARGEELPFRDGTFDTVLYITVLPFMEDPAKALEEGIRVLKGQGEIVIGMIDRKSPLGRSYEEGKERNPFYREAHFFTPEEVISLMAPLGFDVHKTLQTLFGPTPEGEQPIEEGYGRGGFVAMAFKRRR